MTYLISAESLADQGADCHDVDDTHWINGWVIFLQN